MVYRKIQVQNLDFQNWKLILFSRNSMFSYISYLSLFLHRQTLGPNLHIFQQHVSIFTNIFMFLIAMYNAMFLFNLKFIYIVHARKMKSSKYLFRQDTGNWMGSNIINFRCTKSKRCYSDIEEREIDHECGDMFPGRIEGEQWKSWIPGWQTILWWDQQFRLYFPSLLVDPKSKVAASRIRLVWAPGRTRGPWGDDGRLAFTLLNRRVFDIFQRIVETFTWDKYCLSEAG